MNNQYQDMNNFFEHMLIEEDQWHELNLPSEDIDNCIGGFSEAGMDSLDDPESYDKIRGE